jgi:RNA polymerase sigma-70 factor, ECF subfamily
MQHSPDARQETAGYPSTATTEGVLVERCKAGDHAAFAELIRQTSRTARRAIRAITRNPADVDDVMQDTLVKAFLGLRSFNQQSKFSTWLTRIAINNALMLLRRQKSNKEISLDVDGGERDIESFLYTDSTPDPEAALILDQSIEVVRKAVHALPPTLRGYAQLHCLQELPPREAASSLGISLAAGKARLFHARRRLAQSLTSLRSRPAAS